MSSAMDRRHWIKSSALATAAWAIGRERMTAADASGAADGETIYLDQNENPHGISGKARKAIIDTIKLANRYPGDETAELRDLMAAREGVPNDHVVLGAGSTEIFSLAGLLYGADGKEVLLAEPTYFGFKSYIDRIKGKLNSVPLDSRWEHDLDEMARRFTPNTSLVYICNPNNPTGTIVDSGKLRSFCESAARSAMVFVDEAYGDLVEDSRYSSMVDLVKKNANVMIARTFSKIHGLAGMRIGYGIARPEIIEQFRRIQTNFAPLSQLSIAAAKASYMDAEFLSFSKTRNAEARASFYKLLAKLGHKPILGSQTNFVIFPIDRKPEDFVAEFRKQHNIVLRPFEFLEKKWIRVSMGTKYEMARLAGALQKS
jgi:histidinol-phosphate aminotransferase